MENMHEIFPHLNDPMQKSMLATIVHVDGSAYRREGTTMLFKEDGTQIGLLSAGCIEEDLYAQFVTVWENGTTWKSYDLNSEDDLSWGVDGSGCNGVVTVLLEPVTAKLREELTWVEKELKSGNWVARARSDSETYYQSKSGQWLGEKCLAMSFSGDETSGFNEQNKMYIHIVRPKPRLILFGAQIDARPFVQFASQSGFAVHVCDWRPAFCQRYFFPQAEAIYLGFPHEVLPQLSFSPNDYVVLMTHHFDRDREIMLYMLNQEVAYIGVLGSKKRTNRLLATSHLPDKVRSPIGLSIQAEGPHEIAISIVAELIQESKHAVRRITVK